MADVVDLTEAMEAFLKTHAAAADIRARVVGGANSIYQAGDVTPSLLSAQEAVRTDESLILAVSLQDAGEAPSGTPNVMLQKLVIRGYDRFNGARSLRLFREALLAPFRVGSRALTVTVGRNRGLLVVQYGGNAGHNYDTRYQTDYVPVFFQALLEYGG